MISPVSFRAVSKQSTEGAWKEKVARPQTHNDGGNGDPIAATGIGVDEGAKKKGGAGKLILGLTIAAAAVCTALGLGAHKNLFAGLKGSEKAILQKLGNALDGAGNAIKNAFIAAKDKIGELIPKGGVPEIDPDVVPNP